LGLGYFSLAQIKGFGNTNFVGRKKVMDNNNPSDIKGDNLPVEKVSWNDINEDGGFLDKLNEEFFADIYRLPTEAEWEYAARAGADFIPDNVDDYAWYGDNSTRTQPVAQKKSNPWGLYDMLGNVIEWVQDRYDKDYYSSPHKPTDDPKGPKTGAKYVVRGGARHLGESYMSATHRFGKIALAPTTQAEILGFRLVRESQ
jgi:formylglycine-generating enzyme required for sulfatase activity